MGEWKHGLFGCFDNFGICIITFIAPCVTAGQVAESVGKSCLIYGCLSMCACIGIWTTATVRGLIREQKGIDGSFANDCLLHFFCAFCALCQEGQEVKDNGGAIAQSMARY